VEALAAIPVPLTRFEPNGERQQRYAELYAQVYQRLAPDLESAYRAVERLDL